MYTDPDPQFLAPARSLEIGQECPLFSTCRPGNPVYRLKGQVRSLGRLLLRRKMRHIFRKGDQRRLILVRGWSRTTCVTDMRGDVKMSRSCRQSDACLPVTRQQKVADTPKLAGRLSVSMSDIPRQVWYGIIEFKVPLDTL